MSGNALRTCFSVFFRLKTVDYKNVEKTKLARCLNTLDLTALGIGSTLGAGIYVVAGQVAKETAGPSVVLSFFIAAVASIFAGLCYAEFGARVPKTGSAYVYTYVTVGEFLAFVIGWNLILEYVIGTASVASAWSKYFDSLIDNRINNFFDEHMHMDVPFLGHHPDFFAFGITIVLAVVLAVGVKESTTFNNVFTGVNLLIVLYSVICGAFKADTKNWSLPPHPHNVTINNHTHIEYDDGGFMPFGFSQMLAGASTCFYAFVGFDAIATTGEEVRNPQRAIPIGIIVSLLACCGAYCSVSVILTLMVPYYNMDDSAPLPVAFQYVGYTVARWIISIGAIAGLSTSLLGAMFPLPRIIYAMASDGLLFRSLASVSQRFKTPFIATILSGLFAGVMATVFDLDQLVEMMSIGTLMAYTLVSYSVLLLRYKVDSEERNRLMEEPGTTFTNYPTEKSQKTVAIAIVVQACFALLMGIAVLLEGLDDVSGKDYIWILFGFGAVGSMSCVVVMYRQPQSQASCTFKVPVLPIIASLSGCVNIVLMLKLQSATWIRFAVWMAIGLVIYFGYGMWNSSERYGGYSEVISEEKARLVNSTHSSEADEE